jgi:hypothetical protein
MCCTVLQSTISTTNEQHKETHLATGERPGYTCAVLSAYTTLCCITNWHAEKASPVDNTTCTALMHSSALLLLGHRHRIVQSHAPSIHIQDLSCHVTRFLRRHESCNTADHIWLTNLAQQHTLLGLKYQCREGITWLQHTIHRADAQQCPTTVEAQAPCNSAPCGPHPHTRSGLSCN